MSNLKYKHTAYTSAQWASLNPVIVENEIVIESDTKRTKIGNGISTYNELEYADANSVGNSLGSIKPTDAAPTPARNGNYTFSIGGNKPAWLTAEDGVTAVKAGDGVAVVFTAPSSYSYTHVDTGSAIEQVRSRSQYKSPSSKLFDDSLANIEIKTDAILPTKNKIITSEVKFGYAWDVVNAGFNTTGYIDVSTLIGQTLILSKLGIAANIVRQIELLTVDKVRIGSLLEYPNLSTAWTIPSTSGLHYIRLAILTTDSGTDVTTFLTKKIQLELGNTVTTYIEGMYVVKSIIEDNAVTESKIAANSISQSKISAGSVSEDKTIFFDIVQNLFNPNDCAYLDAWGSPNSSYNTSGYIDVHTLIGKGIYASNNNGVGIVIRQIKIYDVNHIDLYGMIDFPAQGYIIPNNAYFLKAAILTSYMGTTSAMAISNKLQIEASTKVNPYIEFGTFIAKIKSSYLDAETIKNAIEDTNIAKTTSKLYLTDKTVDLFYKCLLKNFDYINNRYLRASITNATIVRQFKNMLTITPAANGILTLKTYDDSFTEKATSNITTVVTSKDKTGNFSSMFIGSSITAGAQYIEKLQTLCGVGLTIKGTRRANVGGVKFEGVGGWGLSAFASYRITKIDATSPFWHPTTGRYWGVVGFWKDVMTYSEFDGTNPNSYVQNGRKQSAIDAGFDSNGYITNSNGRLQVNDIMYNDTNATWIQWDGSAWNTIALPATWGFDFVKYGNMWGITAPTVFVMAELSTNDFRNSTTNPNFTTWNANAEAMITALKIWNSSIKVAMLIPISTFGSDYSLGEFVQSTTYRMYQSRINQIINFDNREAQGIYLIDDAIFYDDDYGYPLSTDAEITKPNQQYIGSESLRVQIKSPHPSNEGRYLLAEGIFGFLQFCR